MKKLSDKMKKHLDKLHASNIGKPSPIKGRKLPPFSQEWKDNISKGSIGKKHTEEAKKKMSISKKGKKKTLEWRKQMSIRVKGSGNPQWKGGVSSLHQQIRNDFKYRQWRSDVFQRDKYTCQLCSQKGGYKEVDHIKPMNQIMKENNIDSIEKAICCEELWNINNGRTLCKPCHAKTPTYGVKVHKYV